MTQSEEDRAEDLRSANAEAEAARQTAEALRLDLVVANQRVDAATLRVAEAEARCQMLTRLAQSDAEEGRRATESQRDEVLRLEASLAALTAENQSLREEREKIKVRR